MTPNSNRSAESTAVSLEGTLVQTTSRHRSSVFMVASGNPTNGVLATTSFVKSQADSLKAAKCEVFLTIVDDRTSVRGILRNIQRIRGEAARFRPGIIHAQYGSVTAAVANLIKGSLPLIVSFCGDDLLGTPIPGVVWRIRERCSRAIGLWAARRAAAIIVKSHNLLQALPPRLREKAIVLPNGVDMRVFQPMDRDECRTKLGWDQGLKIVLFDASLNEDQGRKNPALARATIELVTKTMPNSQLHMMSGVAHEQVPLLMNAADCLLVTSLQEGSANIVKEAMACNLPVVSVPCGDVSERLSRTYPGAIRPYDVASLAEAVHEVIAAGRRSNGREQVIAQGLTTTQIAERLLHIYLKVQEQQQSEDPENHYRKPCVV